MTSLQLVALTERLLTFSVGVGFGWMGYRLLYAGLYEHAAQVKESSAEGDVLWKQLLPGLTFALFAGVIVVGGLFQPPIAALTSRPSGDHELPADVKQPLSEQPPPLDIDIDLLPARPLNSPVVIPEAGSYLSLPEAGSTLSGPETDTAVE